MDLAVFVKKLLDHKIIENNLFARAKKRIPLGESHCKRDTETKIRVGNPIEYCYPHHKILLQQYNEDLSK